VPLQLDENSDDKELLKDDTNWYDSIEEASLRLVNSVILYDGEPVYVTQCDQNQDVYGDNLIRVFFLALPLKTNEHMKTYRRVISSPKFDFKPFPLGFMVINGGLFYLGRGAIRKYQQGLTEGNLSVTSVNKFNGYRVRLSDLIYMDSFYKLIKGDNYPELANVQQAQDPWNPLCVPISRSFAVIGEDNGSLSLAYGKLGQVIGRVERGTPVLNPKFEYLREFLKKETGHG
jgi:hypothetical protein